jgi:hypothetical protein
LNASPLFSNPGYLWLLILCFSIFSYHTRAHGGNKIDRSNGINHRIYLSAVLAFSIAMLLHLYSFGRWVVFAFKLNPVIFVSLPLKFAIAEWRFDLANSLYCFKFAQMLDALYFI